MYGYFTHGTDPPPRPCSSGFLSLSHCLRLPPSPTHFGRRFLGCTAFDCASDTVRQSDYWQSVARRFTLAYRSAYSGATRDSASPPEVTHCSSVPCRPQAPWCGGRMSNAFASILQARPCPTFGRPVHLWGRPLDYGPVLLLMPFRFHLAMDTLPSGVLHMVAS